TQPSVDPCEPAPLIEEQVEQLAQHDQRAAEEDAEDQGGQGGGDARARLRDAQAEPFGRGHEDQHDHRHDDGQPDDHEAQRLEQPGRPVGKAIFRHGGSPSILRWAAALTSGRAEPGRLRCVCRARRCRVVAFRGAFRVRCRRAWRWSAIAIPWASSMESPRPTALERAEALAEVGRLLVETLDLGVVAQRIVDGLRAILQAPASSLYRVDPETADLIALAISGNLGPPS